MDLFLTESLVELSNGERFSIFHNLEQFGLNIDDALINWLARTNVYTNKSFCEYLEDKDPENIIALTAKEFYELMSKCDA